jgi:hypothetical protein
MLSDVMRNHGSRDRARQQAPVFEPNFGLIGVGVDGHVSVHTILGGTPPTTMLRHRLTNTAARSFK